MADEPEPVADLPNIDKLFMETVKGRYPLADGPSSAHVWAPKEKTVLVQGPPTGDPPVLPAPVRMDVIGQYVPRPDRSMVILQALTIFGFLGLDHLYLRSTKTGIIKLLTLGGLGIWWIWDMLQVFTERERVLNYGMSTPFDVYLGIGQGMITDKGTSYSQGTSWMLLTISSVFGFLGAPFLLLGKPWVCVRFLMAYLISAGLIVSFLAIMRTDGVSTAIGSMFWSFIFQGIFLAVFLVGILPTWFTQLSAFFGSPEGVMNTGLQVPSYTEKVFGWWRSIYKKGDNIMPEDKSTYAFLMREFMPTNISGADIRARLWIGRNENVVAGSAEDEEEEGDGVPPINIAGRLGKNAWDGFKDFIMDIVDSVSGRKQAMELAAAAASGKGGLGDLAAGLAGGKGGLGGLAAGLAGGKTSGLAATAGKLGVQLGGARAEPALSTESIIIGAVLAAIIGGGAVKAAVDYTFNK